MRETLCYLFRFAAYMFAIFAIFAGVATFFCGILYLMDQAPLDAVTIFFVWFIAFILTGALNLLLCWICFKPEYIKDDEPEDMPKPEAYDSMTDEQIQ